jgi:hypothetical protein
MPSTAAVTVSSRRILYNDDEWIWPGYVPTSAVTVIAGGITAPTALLAVKILGDRDCRRRVARLALSPPW